MLIKKGRLSEYVKGGKRDEEESQKAKSSPKVSEIGSNGDKKDTIKGKHPYIKGGKRGAEMFIFFKIEGSSSPKSSDRPKLGFQDSKKVGDIHNELFPLIITFTIGQLDVFWIPIDKKVLATSSTTCYLRK